MININQLLPALQELKNRGCIHINPPFINKDTITVAGVNPRTKTRTVLYVSLKTGKVTEKTTIFQKIIL